METLQLSDNGIYDIIYRFQTNISVIIIFLYDEYFSNVFFQNLFNKSVVYTSLSIFLIFTLYHQNGQLSQYTDLLKHFINTTGIDLLNYNQYDRKLFYFQIEFNLCLLKIIKSKPNVLLSTFSKILQIRCFGVWTTTYCLERM